MTITPTTYPTTSTPANGVVGGSQTYPEIPELAGTELDGAFRRLWEALESVPETEMHRREAAAEAVAAAAAEYERQRARARRRPSAAPSGHHHGFLTAFDAAAEAAKGLQRREAARLAAKATARFLTDHPDGRTVERLTGIYTRFGSAVSRAEGAVLAGELEVGTGQVRDPLGLLHFRCQRAAEVAP